MSPCDLSITIETIIYSSEHINIKLLFVLQPGLLEELLLLKIKHLLTSQNYEFYSDVV